MNMNSEGKMAATKTVIETRETLVTSNAITAFLIGLFSRLFR